MPNHDFTLPSPDRHQHSCGMPDWFRWAAPTTDRLADFRLSQCFINCHVGGSRAARQYWQLTVVSEDGSVHMTTHLDWRPLWLTAESKHCRNHRTAPHPPPQHTQSTQPCHGRTVPHWTELHPFHTHRPVTTLIGLSHEVSDNQPNLTDIARLANTPNTDRHKTFQSLWQVAA